ncbi:PIN domain-containing protein [Pollutimonas thiosulfatoxidans]|uniref:VapC toxin family PIN domain ribonuclease n=1 Tax=Pollutimonas thiosulfatoxidans TaxID=2028345 RepID=A0A410G9Q0_9BURK|nr:type II toxin-antitoxin system VapC family toxin [Pollutimonas thiosulfatoxidans]QAA93030.1 VapC toxin family PIN domain ribonuclease [Pollutimonas thiosulfatoxidans]
MIGLDTNVLVRYIMQDDPKQSSKASVLIESLDTDSPGFVALVSVVEVYWVLTACFDLSAKQAAQALEVLLRSRQLVVEQADQVFRALRIFEAGKVDFADCLIERSAAAAGCAQTMTFDVSAARHAGMVLLH